MWKAVLIFALYLIINIHGLENPECNRISIPIMRKKTPREQLIIAPNLKLYGIDFGWLHKPHKHNATNDSIALFRYLDSEFYGKVQIGQKAQTFNMVFDTAWRTSWVISEDCAFTTVGCHGHNKYDHTNSFTYRPNGTRFFANEGTYNLTGYYSNDTFLVGHTRINGQLFVEMTSVPPEYVLYKSDGVMGLGFKVDSYDPFFYSMLKNKTIEKPIFSVYLNRDRQSNRGGNLMLGFIEKKHIHQKQVPGQNHSVLEPITYLPVDPSNGWWQFKMDRIVVNITNKNETYPYCVGGCDAIVDTTTNLIIGPINDIKAIHKLIGATSLILGRSRVKCDTVNKLPPIDFMLAGKNFTLKGPQYVQKMSAGPIQFCMSAFMGSADPNEQNMWVLGGAFLSHFYSIYDIANKKIGFVLAA